MENVGSQNETIFSKRYVGLEIYLLLNALNILVKGYIKVFGQDNEDRVNRCGSIDLLIFIRVIDFRMECKLMFVKIVVAELEIVDMQMPRSAPFKQKAGL